MGSVPAIIAVHRLVLSQHATTVVITVSLSIANPVTTEFALPEPVPELVFEAKSALVPPKEIITHPNTSSGVRTHDSHSYWSVFEFQLKAPPQLQSDIFHHLNC